ncbi:FAD binding domain-containing protein [Sulfobacillus thermosulfidooxidans]|uniref:FAD binding domain-containing protein n=1 Tax=Sulfobacillus thermosulfidooxidans TaxID=28034 RepID=UPI0006B57355|nr:xanthine dehydrogenase family protein subunit M [Sulfobacillus thermosulfidooxidans]
MFPNSFEYYAPRSVEEIFGLLEQYGDETKILAGGQSLLPMMKLRLVAPSILIDINGISSWDNVTEQAHLLHIGALVRHRKWEYVLDSRVPLLHQTARHIADPLVRNRGTMGGSLAHADPAADWGAALLALKASVSIQSAHRSREVPLREFFVDTFTTVLEPQELVTGIRIPLHYDSGFVGARYLKLERKVGDFAVVGVAVTLVLDPHGVVLDAGIGLAAVGATPLAAVKAESLLQGHPLTPELIRHVASEAAKESDPVTDRRGSEEYKRAMVNVFVERGLTAVHHDWQRLMDVSA